MKKQIIENCFDINIGEDGYKFQVFNNKIYRLYKGERYFSQSNNRMHIVVFEFYNGKTPKGYHVHHLDENPHNNRIENLELKFGKLHLSDHNKKRFKDNPEWAKEFHAKGILHAKVWHSSEKGTEWHKQHAIKTGFGIREYNKINCKMCKVIFIPKAGHQLFCCQACKQRFRRLQPENWKKESCIICNCIFKRYDTEHNKTCSRKCGGIYKKQIKNSN